MAGRLQTKIILNISYIYLLFLIMSCNSSKTTDVFLYDRDILQSGDIIMRRSFGLVSDVIVATLKDSIALSHCGIIYKTNDSIFVIHTLSQKVSDYDGMQICTLDDFLNDSKLSSIRISRFRDDRDKQIARKAKYYLEKRIPFDEKIDINDTTTFFCSELPIHIIKNSFGVNLIENRKTPKFSVFLDETHFELLPFTKKANQ